MQNQRPCWALGTLAGILAGILTAALASQSSVPLATAPQELIAAPPEEGAARKLPAGVELARLTEMPPCIVDAPTAEETIAVGRGYKARISAAGLQFCALPGPTLPLAPLELSLARVRVGNVDLPVHTRKLPDEGQTCVLDHGTLREHLDLRPEGVEQSFHFATLPERGELILHLAAKTELAVVSGDDGFTFGDDLRMLHYGAATAVDALGRCQPCTSRWVDGGLEITVPREFVDAAALPLVVDPLLWAPKTWVLGTGTGANLSVEAPDMAYSMQTGSWLLVWQVQVASNDHDVYARRFNFSWQPLTTTEAVDQSTQDWTLPRVARIEGAGQWHVAAYASVWNEWGANIIHSVRVRRWGALGAIGGSIALDTFHVLPDPKFSLVIGGDPFPSTTSVSLVAYAAQAPLSTTWWVSFVVVGSDGSVSTRRQIELSGVIRDLALSKGNGGNRWLLGWAEDSVTTKAASIAYRGVLIDRLGNLVPLTSGSSILFASFPFTGTRPLTQLCVGSPDRNGVSTVGYVDAPHGSVRLRRVSNVGILTSPIDLQSVAPGWGVRITQIETDGSRILALKADGNFVRAALLAYVPMPGTWRLDDDFLIGASLPVSRFQVSSRFVGSHAVPPTPFTLAYASANSSVSTVRVVDYEGPLSGSSASEGGVATFPLACGEPLAITSDATAPRLGNTLRFSLDADPTSAGFLVGRPVRMPLTGLCSCTLGVDGVMALGSVLALPIPTDPNVLGSTLAIQGISFKSGPCLGRFSLSDSIEMRIH